MATEVVRSRRRRNRSDWFETYSRSRNSFVFRNDWRGETWAEPPANGRVVYYGVGLCPDVGPMSHFWWPHSDEPDYEFTEGEPSEVAAVHEEEEYISPGPLPRSPSVESLAQGMGSNEELCGEREVVQVFLRHIRGEDEGNIPAWMERTGIDKEEEEGAGRLTRSNSLVSIGDCITAVEVPPADVVDLGKRPGKKRGARKWRRLAGIIGIGAGVAWALSKLRK
ncbi:hypothetical protein BSKO_09399 [Bryopsis sp. KO-2023]|nr:hypothetical protein BSKO_09399 [Bryopsis sp. KO-2023]